jgi:hypothetical protein
MYTDIMKGLFRLFFFDFDFGLVLLLQFCSSKDGEKTPKLGLTLNCVNIKIPPESLVFFNDFFFFVPISFNKKYQYLNFIAS